RVLFRSNNYMYVDRNMKESPFFRLANEGNRGVFVPATGINAQNGAADWTTGRESTAVSRVLELVSEGRIDQYALVLDATARYYKDGQLSRSEEHTSELQSRENLVCRLLLEKKK